MRHAYAFSAVHLLQNMHQHRTSYIVWHPQDDPAEEVLEYFTTCVVKKEDEAEIIIDKHLKFKSVSSGSDKPIDEDSFFFIVEDDLLLRFEFCWLPTYW